MSNWRHENFIELKDRMKIAADAQSQYYSLIGKPTEGAGITVDSY